MNHAPPRRPLRRLGAPLAALAATLLLLEIGARLSEPWLSGVDTTPRLGAQAGAGSDALRQKLYRSDPRLFFRLQPHLRIAQGPNPRIFDLRTNSLGLRDSEIELPKPPGRWRILALGDSCTFGSGAGQSDTWPAQLEAELAKALGAGRAEVVNAGVPGYSTFQSLRFLQQDGLGLEPDAVVIPTSINDASPAKAGPKRNIAAGRLLNDRAYAEQLENPPRSALQRLLLRAGLIGSGSPATRPAAGIERRVPLEDYGGELRAGIRAARERGVRVVLLGWPLQAEVRIPPGNDEASGIYAAYRQRAAEIARDERVAHVDLLPVLRGKAEHYVDGVHLGPQGYQWVARALEPWLLPEPSPAAQP